MYMCSLTTGVFNLIIIYRRVATIVNVLMVCQDLEPGLKEVVMKVALAGTEDHTALDSLLPLLDIPQVPVPPIT